MKDGKSSDLKSVEADVYLTLAPSFTSHHPFPMFVSAFLPLKWQNSKNLPTGDLTNPELQIILVSEIKSNVLQMAQS